MKGTSSSASPPSKPTACAARRRALRPRTGWRASQRSNRALNSRFQATAMSELPTATPPACAAASPLAMKASVTTPMAISSYKAT